MKTKGRRKDILGKARKSLNKMGKEFSQSPLARAARGKRTKGYL